MKPYLSLFLIASLTSSCDSLLEMKDGLLGSVANAIPWDFENSMGDQLLPSVLPPGRELKDEAAVRELEALLSPLTSVIDQPKIRVHISKDKELNAFAIPGGHLIFNSGMLLAAESPEEILGVASHEIAHASERHVTRSMIQGLSIYAVIAIFLGDIGGIGAVIIDQGQALIQSGFSRSQEMAADELGLDRLIDARINPNGMLKFFERLEKEAVARGQGSDELAKFLSTHPLTKDRIAAINERVALLPEKTKATWKPVAFDLKSFQSKLR